MRCLLRRRLCLFDQARWATAIFEFNMIHFTCPSCGASYNVGDEFAGRTTKCRKCVQPLQVPAITRTSTVPAQIVIPKPVQETIPEALPADPVPEVLPVSLVTFAANGQVRVDARSAAEAKAAIRELKAKKKELSLSKRAIMQKQREIRAAYTDLVRRRGSKFIGGSSVGRIIRTFQTMNRDAARRQLANELAPLEQQRSRIEAWSMAIDSVIIQLQGCTW